MVGRNVKDYPLVNVNLARMQFLDGTQKSRRFSSSGTFVGMRPALSKIVFKLSSRNAMLECFDALYC